MLFPCQLRAPLFLAALSLAAGCGAPAESEEPEPPPFCDGPELLIDDGNQGASAVAADSSGVYWAKYYGSIRKAPVQGGEITGLTILGKWAPPERMALDADNLYWADRTERTIAFIPKKGGDVTVLAVNQEGLTALAVDEHHVYWSDSVLGTVSKRSKQGGPISELASGIDRPVAMVLDHEALYVAFAGTRPWGGGILAIDKETGSSRSVLQFLQWGPCGIASDAENLYFSYVARNPALSADSIGVVAKSGGDITQLATGVDGVCDVAVDREDVYYIGSTLGSSPFKGFLRRVPKSGGSVTTMSELEGRSYAGLARYGDALFFTRAWSNQDLPSVHRVCR